MPWQPIPDETPFDPSQLKPALRGIVTTRAELNDFEAANVRKALAKYLGSRPNERMAPFNLTWAKKLHQEMFGDVLDQAGEYRKENRNVGVDWRRIETSLFGLLEDLRAWDAAAMSLLEQAARLHHQAVYLHPFANGNGRWSRLLSNIWLALHDQVPVDWPDVELGDTKSPVRNDYINAIKAADGGDFAPLLNLHLRFQPAR